MNKKIVWCILASVVIHTSSVFAQAVTSDDFVLKNASGQTTARLTTSGEGTPALFFYDVNNKIRISIGLYKDGVPGVVLNDENEKAGAIMRLVSNQGNPVLVLKENGEDKLIIDKNGVPKSTSSSPIVSLALAFLAGIFGGMLGVTFMPKNKQVPPSAPVSAPTSFPVAQSTIVPITQPSTQPISQPFITPPSTA